MLIKVFTINYTRNAHQVWVNFHFVIFLNVVSNFEQIILFQRKIMHSARVLVIKHNTSSHFYQSIVSLHVFFNVFVIFV